MQGWRGAAPEKRTERDKSGPVRKQDLKRNRGTQAMVKSVEELEANTQEFMDKLSDDSAHVKSYFNHPALDDYKLD